jgi:Holliday junction DNA helicase RuvA
MIARLRGTLVDKGIDHVILDVGGVGFRVTVSLNTLAALPMVGQPAELHTELLVREDALTLVGFAGADERVAFELCTSVQGIGPKLAMSILSTLEPALLAEAVRSGDVARLVRIPGVGKKTAERLVLELRDKFDKTAMAARASATARPSGGAQPVVSALTNLGYKPSEAERAAADAAAELPGAPVEQILKRALRSLAE